MGLGGTAVINRWGEGEGDGKNIQKQGFIIINDVCRCCQRFIWFSCGIFKTDFWLVQSYGLYF